MRRRAERVRRALAPVPSAPRKSRACAAPRRASKFDEPPLPPLASLSPGVLRRPRHPRALRWECASNKTRHRWLATGTQRVAMVRDSPLAPSSRAEDFVSSWLRLEEGPEIRENGALVVEGGGGRRIRRGESVKSHNEGEAWTQRRTRRLAGPPRTSPAYPKRPTVSPFPLSRRRLVERAYFGVLSRRSRRV